MQLIFLNLIFEQFMGIDFCDLGYTKYVARINIRGVDIYIYFAGIRFHGCFKEKFFHDLFGWFWEWSQYKLLLFFIQITINALLTISRKSRPLVTKTQNFAYSCGSIGDEITDKFRKLQIHLSKVSEDEPFKTDPRRAKF